MGYRKEKQIIEGKKHRIKRVFLCIFAALLLALAVFAYIVPPSSWKYRINKPDLTKRGDGELRIHFLDVGQGDCTLIELPDEKVMLIDGGDGRREANLTILRYLNALEIDEIDYLVATHADSDHCGGLQEIIEQKKVLNAYLPPVDPKEAGGAYDAFYEELVKQKYKWEYASRAVQLSSEGEYPYTLAFLHPYAQAAEDIQNSAYVAETNVLSSVIWLDYMGASALFMGDAPVSVENRLMRDDGMQLFNSYDVELTSTEILKVAHHGSADSTSVQFLGYLQAKTAVISCGKGNLYGHPDEETVNNLNTVKADVYRTDEDGTVVVTVSKSGTYIVS